VSTRIRATIEDLSKVEGKAELVRGEIVEIPPTGDNPGFASLKIAARLLDYAERTGRGRAYADNAGFRVYLPSGILQIPFKGTADLRRQRN
jgi:hypothetical protein